MSGLPANLRRCGLKAERIWSIISFGRCPAAEPPAPDTYDFKRKGSKMKKFLSVLGVLLMTVNGFGCLILLVVLLQMLFSGDLTFTIETQLIV